MEIIRALKMRIYPNKTQQQKIDATIGHCRYVYNHMLERNRKVYARRKEHLSYISMQNLLPKMKKYLPWLKEADSQALKYACREVDTAFKNFFTKRAKFPHFHSRKATVQGYVTTNAHTIHYEPHYITIPCLGRMRCSDKRELNGKICNVSVSRQNGKYYASLLYKYEKEVILKPIAKAIGLDYSSPHLYKNSEGDTADMPHWYKKAQEHLARVQRKLKRKRGRKKGEKLSCAYRKILKRIGKIHRHIACQREDFLRKLSLYLAENYDTVCIEDLDMKAMSNKGFGNGKATMDNAYGKFRVMLGYKLTEHGGRLAVVDKWFPSSQLCSNCGYQNAELKDLRIREWTCPRCGVHHDRDVNAAINIRDEGLRLLRETT